MQYGYVMKVPLTIRVDRDLRDFLTRYAKENHTTVTAVITRYVLNLKKRTQRNK